MTLPDEFDGPGAAPGRMDWKLWRRFAARTLRFRGPLAGIVGGGILIALIEGLRPMVNAGLLDRVAHGGFDRTAQLLAGLWLLMALLFGAGVYTFIAAAGRLATGLAFQLREDAFSRLQELPFAYFDTRPVGWLLSRLTSDCSRVSGIAPWVILDLFWATALMSAAAVAMLWMKPLLALAVLAIVPFLFGTSIAFTRLMVGTSRQARRANSAITANFSESIAGIRTTRALCRQEAALGEFRVIASDLQAWSTRNAMQGAIYTPIVSTLTAVGAAIAAGLGGEWVRRADLTPGELIAFCQYAMLFMYPAQDLAQRFADLLSAQAAAERVQSLIDTEPEIRDSEAVLAAVESQRRDPVQGRATDGGPLQPGCIRFDAVDFWYVEGEPVIEGLTLSVEPGQTIALVGPTGGGKTTIVSLVCRFYEPRRGAVRMAGVDLRERSLSWLHSRLGVVQQVPWLFNDTIRANVRFGRLEATDAEVDAALARVGAAEFVSRLPGGAEFMVGEGGERLSQGQRQLVSLARAVLRDPAIFVMDEATSSVDAETERTIQSAIEEVFRGRTSFVIAHRLSTVRRADRILFVDAGRILEDGPHERLMAIPGGRYRQLYLRQFEEEREAAILGP